MAKRFIRSRPKHDRLLELRERLESGEIEIKVPFGRVVTKALENARFDPMSEEAVWIEEVTAPNARDGACRDP